MDLIIFPVRANTRLFVIVYTLPVCICVCVCESAKIWLIESIIFFLFVPLSFKLIIMFPFNKPNDENMRLSFFTTPFYIIWHFDIIFFVQLFLFVVSKNYKQTNGEKSNIQEWKKDKKKKKS